MSRERAGLYVSSAFKIMCVRVSVCVCVVVCRVSLPCVESSWLHISKFAAKRCGGLDLFHTVSVCSSSLHN